MGLTHLPVQWSSEAVVLRVKQPGHEADYFCVAPRQKKILVFILPVPHILLWIGA
jgi:hypothetical protein